MNKLKIVAVSDLHGYLPEITESADIMLIAGDVSPLNIQFNKPKCKKWFETEFAYWIKSLPVDKVYMVAGNHDAYFEGMNPMNLAELKHQCSFKLIYLENAYIVHRHNGEEYKIFGTPYCHIFGNWPYMVSDEYMERLLLEMPEECDIIISHDPPYGIGQVDQILESRRHNRETPESLGNPPLAKQLTKTKFKLLVCGHIHSGDHNPFEFNGGIVVNVSIKDENYQPNYQPFYIELIK
jgi:Icc-related predicted phosphoesterase